MTYDNRQFYIDGAWVNPATPKEFKVINPATEEVAGVISMGSAKDVDLAVWVSRLDELDELRRARGSAVGEIVAERGHGPAVHEIEVFLLEPGTNSYLGRLCYFRQCPAGKRDCLADGCGREPFLKQHDESSFYPDAVAESAAVRLYDRGGGIMAHAVDLPLIILDGDP